MSVTWHQLLHAHLAGLDLLGGILQDIGGHMLEVAVQSVASGHQVVVVDGLDEGLLAKER